MNCCNTLTNASHRGFNALCCILLYPSVMALEILLKGIAAFTSWNRTWLGAYIVFKFNMYYNSRTVGGMILIWVETWIIISYNITGLRVLPITAKKQKRKILMEPQKKKKNIGVLAARDANNTSGKLLFFFFYFLASNSEYVNDL